MDGGVHLRFSPSISTGGTFVHSTHTTHNHVRRVPTRLYAPATVKNQGDAERRHVLILGLFFFFGATVVVILFFFTASGPRPSWPTP